MIHSKAVEFERASSRQIVQTRSYGELLEALALAEATAAESQRQFDSVLRSLSGLFYRCEIDPPWRMSFISEGVEVLTGFSAEDISRKDGWSELIVPQDRGRIGAAASEAVANRTSFNFTYRISRADGDVRWVSEIGQAVYDTVGEPLFLEGVITDVSGREESEELQRTLMARWRKTLDHIPQMVWSKAADGSDEFYNSQWTEFAGRPVSSADFGLDSELVHPDDRARMTSQWAKSFSCGEDHESQYRLKHRSGAYRWVLSRGIVEVDPDGCPIRWYGSCTDVHEYVLARQALQASEAFNRSIVDATPDSISLLSNEGDVQYVNSSTLDALGLDSDKSLLGRSWSSVFSSSARGPSRIALSHAKAGRPGHFSTSQASLTGPKWWDIILAPIKSPNEQQTGILAIARDITHQKTAEERVRWAGQHDPLTQLPNRTLFQRALDQRLIEGEETGASFSVLMVDLDDFKSTNDALGHDAGDALLSEFAQRLRRAIRADDVVARLGGDEFAVLLQGVGSGEAVEDAIALIRQELAPPCVFDGKVLDIKASIGASIYPQQGTSRGELLKHADIALYAAKAAGRGVHRVFEASMRAEAQNRLSMLSLATEALARDLIAPFYQPKVDLRTGKLNGFEALLRWNHPEHGVQTPDAIGAAFQDVTLAAEISDRMIDLVIEDLRGWTDRGLEFGHVAVNAAAAEFRKGDFAERLLERLHRAQLPTSCLQLEVTETVFLGRGSEHVENALKQLSSAGVKIALDDFGTGYASLSHLNHFPVDVIKIDRSFIKNLETSPHDAAIVRAVINLGRSLDILIVGEGVETEAQAAYLRKHRCHSAQGYLFGKARPSSDVDDYVQRYLTNIERLPASA